MSEVEKALEEIQEKEADAGNTLESGKKKSDPAMAVKMRKGAMESMPPTQKRIGVGEVVDDDENAQAKRNIKRRSGGETIGYLGKLYVAEMES